MMTKPNPLDTLAMYVLAVIGDVLQRIVRGEIDLALPLPTQTTAPVPTDEAPSAGDDTYIDPEGVTQKFTGLVDAPKRRVYPDRTGYELAKGKLDASLTTPYGREILKILHRRPGIGKKKLMELTGYPGHTVANLTSEMSKAGLIVSVAIPPPPKKGRR